MGQKLDGDNLQDVLDAGRNAAKKGRQQFFTALEIARALTTPLPRKVSEGSFVDFTMGSGNLLIASGATDLYGVDIDSRLARKQGAGSREQGAGQQWHCVNADLTKFYPLLHEVDWRFDLCGLNPPFSVQWVRAGLALLLDSECEAVAQTFAATATGKVGKDHIDSVLATLLIALDRMNERGEGYLLCSATTAEKISSLPVFSHVWLWATIAGSTEQGAGHSIFGKDVRPFDTAVLYFARSHTGPGPLKLDVGCSAFDVRRSLESVATQRPFLRRGLSIHNVYDFTTSRTRWDAAKQEYLRQSRHSSLATRHSEFNIWLGSNGTIQRHLTPFQNYSGKIPGAKAAALDRLQGQRPMALVVQRHTRTALLDCIRPSGVGLWRVQPELITHIEAAIAEYHSQRAPFYPLNEVQRLGYLDEEDRIRCKRAWSTEQGAGSFIAGKTYELSSETIKFERSDQRPNLLGKLEKVTLSGNELAFYIVDENKARHCFSNVPLDQQAGVTRHSSLVTRHSVETLIRHFEIPAVADVAQTQPERYQQFVSRIKQIEEEINRVKEQGSHAAAA
jgi:predicted RNA methylase